MAKFNYGLRRRQAWMKKFADRVVSARTDLAGKIDWYTANYLYTRNMKAEEAADQYLKNTK